MWINVNQKHLSGKKNIPNSLLSVRSNLKEISPFMYSLELQREIKSQDLQIFVVKSLNICVFCKYIIKRILKLSGFQERIP